MNSRNFLAPGFPPLGNTFPKAAAQSTKPKLKIPDLNTEIQKDQSRFYIFNTSLYPPPLSVTSCFVQETTNSDYNLLRSSMYILPKNSHTFDSLHIPFAICITPFNFKSDCRRQINRNQALRCGQCQAYANINSMVSSDFWNCNICKHRNKLQQIFNCKYPTMEFYSEVSIIANNKTLVDSTYFYNRVVHIPAFIFVIDTRTEMYPEYIESLNRVLQDSSFKNLYKKVAILLIKDTCVALGLQNDNLVEFHIQKDAFLSPDLFIETLNLDKVINFLEKLQNTKNSNIVEIENILLKLSNLCLGSKIAIFANEIFDLKNTESFLEASASIFILSYKPINSTLPYLTSGKILQYEIGDFYKSKGDLYNICVSETAFNVNVAVKISNCISRNAVYANTIVNNLSNITLCSMDNNNSLVYTFYIDDIINEKTGYVQFIIDFYSTNGLYKTLVLNQEFKIGNNIPDIYNGISIDTLFTCFCKYVADDPKNLSNVETIICKFLKNYRKTCFKDISDKQLVLPESAKLLPVLYQSLIKNRMFSISANIFRMKEIVSLNVEQTLRYFYPRLFTLTDYYIEQDLTKIKCQKLSLQLIESGEIYILENSQKIYLYIGKDVDPVLVEALFNNEDEKKVLMKLVGDINGCYGYELPVVVIEEGKKGVESEFFSFMVEDSLNGIGSYYDYVCELHFKIQKV